MRIADQFSDTQLNHFARNLRDDFDFVVIDAPPGSGKTTFANRLHQSLDRHKLDHSLISTDFDLPLKEERLRRSNLEKHGELGLCRELIDRRLCPSSESFMSFTVKIADRATAFTTYKERVIPIVQSGPMIVEGVHSLRVVRSHPLTNHSRIFVVQLCTAEEVAESRRYYRDLAIRGREDALRRIETVRMDFRSYRTDFNVELRTNSFRKTQRYNV